MSKLFSVESLLEDSIDDSFSIRLEDKNAITEPNYIIDNYEFLTNIKQEETAIMACYYKVLSEAGEDQGAILESVSDVIAKIKAVIMKIIDNIVRTGKQICKNIANKINKMSIDKYYKKALEALGSNGYVKFDNAYIFKNLDGSIPAIPSATDVVSTITKTAFLQDITKNADNQEDSTEAAIEAKNGSMILIGILNKMIGISSSPITDIKELYAKLDTLYFDEKERKTIFSKKADIDQYYTNIKNSSSVIEKMYNTINTFKNAISNSNTEIKRTSDANLQKNIINAWRMINEYAKFTSSIYSKFVTAMVFRTNQEISIIKKAASMPKEGNNIDVNDFKNTSSSNPPSKSATESVDIETLGFMAEAMNAKERNSLSDSQFGLPEDRKYPMPDAKHVRSAIKLFGHCEESKKPQLAKRIMKFAKKYGVEVPKDSEVYKYANK